MMAAYKQGVMTDDFLHCSYGDREVNHGVLLVGYGKVTKHDRVNGRCEWYWIIRNSWGPTWGENGFFKICADHYPSKQLPYGTCLVNKYSVWPTMNKSDIDPDFEI
jgi:aminopeptidase C